MTTTTATTVQTRTEETWQELNERVNADPEAFEAAVKTERQQLLKDNLSTHMLLVALEGLEWRLKSYVEAGRVEFALAYLARTQACLDLVEERGLLALANGRSGR